MADLLFICGQVRAQESKLLDVNRLDRMIGANTAEDAFRVFTELQYAEYIDDSTTAHDFSKVILQGLQETKAMLTGGKFDTLEFLWIPFDVNNIKRALKLKLLKNKNFIDDFSEDAGFSLLGNLSEADLSSLVFDNKGEYFEEIVDAIKNAETILAKNGQAFRFVEYALDEACFQILQSKASTSFLRNLLTFLVDSTNLRNLARLTYIMSDNITNEAWLSGGSFVFSSVKDINTVDAFSAFVKRTKFGAVIDLIGDTKGAEAEVILEKFIDKQYQFLLKDASLGEISSESIPYNYFERRMQNSRLLKFIMLAKFNGLDSETIYDRLSKF